MKSLHNSAEHIGLNVEPKEGERALLCSNTADMRSPSLGVTNEFESRESTLDYLASILVEAYFDHKEHERANKE